MFFFKAIKKLAKNQTGFLNVFIQGINVLGFTLDSTESISVNDIDFFRRRSTELTPKSDGSKCAPI